MYVAAAVQCGRLAKRLAHLKDLYQLGDIARVEYLADRDRLVGLADPIGDVAKSWELATQEQRNRLARELFEATPIGNEKVVAMRPRPELIAFFTLDRQARVCPGGSDGIRTRDLCLDRAAC